jgi:hypothetical protein
MITLSLNGHDDLLKQKKNHLSLTAFAKLISASPKRALSGALIVCNNKRKKKTETKRLIVSSAILSPKLPSYVFPHQGGFDFMVNKLLLICVMVLFHL